MAANMGMGGNSHLLMQQRQQQNTNDQMAMQQMVYQQLVQNTPAVPANGWQANMTINDRLGKTTNLISNVMLAMPRAEWSKAASYSLEFEKTCYSESQNRQTYDQRMAGKVAEMVQKRQGLAPGLQNQLNAQAAARQQQAQQAQAQAQQQMMNQNAAMQQQMAARGMMQPGQQGYQHLRGPMQVSPIPQQPHQVGMGTPGLQQTQPNQPQMMVNMHQQRQAGGAPGGLGQMAGLPAQRRMEILDIANKMYDSASEEQRQLLRAQIQTKMTPQQQADMRNTNQDPLKLYYQNQALRAKAHHMNSLYMRQQQGMGPSPNPAQAMQQQQQQLQRQQQHNQHMAMNPNMMNNFGLQAGGVSGGQLFGPTLETIMNEQKAGLLAEQSGQVVVPASQPNRNATPQPMAVMAPQNMPNGPNQQQRPPQMGQAFNLSQVKMNQAAAQSAAQSKAQAAATQGMQGQPGGLGGPAPTSQSPAMNTLTAPMTQPPVAMGGVGQVNGVRLGQGNPPMGQGLDQRFNHQANTRPISMSGNINMNSAAFNQMLSTIPVDQRPAVTAMPPEKIQGLMASWQEQQQQRNALIGSGLQPKQPLPGQPQMGQMGSHFAVNPQQAMNPNAPPASQQAMIQAHLANRNRRTLQLVAQNPQAQVMMDSMVVQEQILNRLRPAPPPDVKNWSQLKAWMATSPLAAQLQSQLLNIQIQHFAELLEKKHMNSAGVMGALSGGPQQQQQAGAPGQPMQPNLPPNFRFPPQVMQVSAAEIGSLQADPRYAGQDHQTLYKIAVKQKQELFIRRFQMERQRKHQEQQAHQLGLQIPPGPVQQQTATTQPEMMGVPNPTASQPPAQKPAMAVSEPTQTGAKNNNNNSNAAKAPQNRPAPPNPSPATAPKNLKRATPDDVPEVSAANNAANQRPNPQPVARPPGQGAQPTPEMTANWSPEQWVRWEQHQRRQGMVGQPTPEELSRLSERLRAINHEEAMANKTPLPELAMPPEERQDMASKLPKLALDMAKVARFLPRWFWIMRDDQRARLFFRARARLVHQFADDKMTQPKSAFSIRAQEMNQYRMLISTMGADMTPRIPAAKKPTPGNTGAAAQTTAAPASAQTATAQSQPAAQVPQQAPLNAANLANLERHTQAINKMHQRSNSKSGQAPAAPTTKQPPFPFGAQKSPVGQPTYFNKPAVTQDTLNPPPPARKKAKTGPQQTSSPALQQSNPPPQAKAQSPEVKRLPQAEKPTAPPRPQFVCQDAQCDMHSAGFPTKEAADAHYQEEHVKPYENPVKFAMDTIQQALGLDSEGHSVQKPKSSDLPNAPPMKASGSKQGQTPRTKVEAASTPMSRDASMRRQGSAQGGKGADNKGTPGKIVHIKPENTPKTSPEKAPTTEDPWANSTVDPQALFATFAPLAPIIYSYSSGTLGAPDVGTYRSRTPNDTPESSKDSGVTDPSSDISERAHLEIDMAWHPLDLDGDMLVDLDAFSMGNNGGLEGDLGDVSRRGADYPSWDDLNMEFSKSDFEKQFDMDMGLYTMDGHSY